MHPSSARILTRLGRTVAALLTLTLVVLAVGAALMFGSDCDGQPCAAEEPYTLSERVMLNEVGVCAVMEQTGVYRYTYRATALGEHRRYLSAQVVPHRITVHTTAGCGEEKPAQVDELAVSVAWKPRLGRLEWARDSLGADVATMREDPQMQVLEGRDVSRVVITPPTGYAVPIAFTSAARAGLSAPVAFGDVVVNVTRTVDQAVRNEAARVVKVKLYPRSGPANIPAEPGSR